MISVDCKQSREMKSSSSTSSILRLNDKNNEEGASSPRKVLRRSNSSSVTVLHQKQLPSYSAERFYILSELQLHSVSPTFLLENHHGVTDDNTTAVTVELSLEGSSSQEASSSLLLPLQPFSILYLVWKPDFDSDVTCTNAVMSFGNESIVPLVHKVQGITRIRRPSLGQSSSSSSLSRCDSDDESNNGEDASEHVPPPNMEQLSDACTRLYLVVEQVCGNNNASTVGEDDNNKAHFEKLERYATELSRWVSTELRGLVQGISIGVANQERAAPGLEACMNALHVGSQDRRRYGNSSTDEGSKSLIGLVAESYADLVGPGDVHHDHSHHRQSVSPPPAVQLQQCIVTAEWSAAGDLMTFAQRAHAVWRDQHQLPPLPRSTSRKKPVRRVQPRATELTPQQQRADILYHCSVVSVLMLYFLFHYRQDVVNLTTYIL